MLRSPSTTIGSWRESLRHPLVLLAVLIALSTLPLLLLSPLFNAPFDRDQGLYGVIARGWLDGAIPYRDLWDNKGPLLFLWYVAAFGWLGENIVGPRLLAALAAGAAVPFVWASGVTLLGRRAGLWAALLFATAFANLFLQANANAEIFMLLPLAAGFWAFARGTRGNSLWWFGLAGAMTALAVMTKQSALSTLAGYGLWLAVLAWRFPQERRRNLAAAALMVVGTAVGFLPFAAYFYYYGALYDFWYAVFWFNLAFAGQFPFVLKLLPPLLWHPLPLVSGAALWFLAVLGAIHLWRRGDRTAGLILTFFIFSELATQWVGKNSPHYNIQLLPAAALAGAVGLQVVVNRWRAGQRGLGRVLLACIAFSIGGAAFVYAWPTPEERFEAQYVFINYADDSIEAREIADRVEALTEPGDYIYEFGYQSDIYFLANRQPASRWLHKRPYLVEPSVLEEIMAELREKRPALILLSFECGYFWEEIPDVKCYHPPPAELKAYVDEHYVYAGHVQYAFFYVRRPPPSGGPTAGEGTAPLGTRAAASSFLLAHAGPPWRGRRAAPGEGAMFETR